MSLIRVALRTSAVRALREGSTYAMQNVHDSLGDPEPYMGDDAKPLINVFTDLSVSETNGKQWFDGDHTIDLVFEIVVSTRINDTENGQSAIIIPATDPAIELGIDIIERQIWRALMGGEGKWAKLWRKTVTGIKKSVSKRGAANDQGHRFAARQLILSVCSIGEPAVNQAPSHAWSDLIANLTADGETGVAEIIARSMIGTNPPETWVQAMQELGLNLDMAYGLGIGPAYLSPLTGEEVIPPLTSGRLGAGEHEFTQEEVEFNVPQEPGDDDPVLP